MHTSRVSTCLLTLMIALSLGASDAALTNEDVIKLVKLGLGEEVVLAKIRQASVVDFRLEPDDLGNLKSAGVSPKIISSDVREGPKGVWELRPKKPLSPGEYGFYTNGMRIFSFGID